MQDRTDSGINYYLQWHDSIKSIPREHWYPLTQNLDNPFLEWEWLYLLERSGSVSPASGWQPCHLGLYNSSRLIAAAPLYIKHHSQGEFVFDQQLARLADRLNIPYYPKLVGMSPFTPLKAYRFLVHPQHDQAYLVPLMQQEIENFCRRHNLSGVHYHFVEQPWMKLLNAKSFASWLHPGFVWENHGYLDFDAFLAGFKSSRRKNIKKERGKLAAQGIKIQALTGDDIQPEHLQSMYSFYLHTNQKYFPWSCKFLTREFFLGLTRKLKKQVLLLAAFGPGHKEPMGMSMLLFRKDRLFGRYWGGMDNLPFLHFSLCYYEPINWAIQQGIQTFDPGMGGEHKLSRGFRLLPNYSLHRIFDPQLQYILTSCLQESNMHLQQNMDELNRTLN
ncbi:GNAT family N-acetyltransferase [Desulfonatronospira sp.]|uniref:GNAT family N-acetyltransferase n=1 Tax=Desulfonatronospira sp. TaxID=1962951 RepID=UPI0025BD7FCA|nr:GNAT family N-acetyltransferase [Desulfonatronospira sp.]